MKKTLTKIAAATAMMASATAFAATNNAAGLSGVHNGDLIISITKGEIVRISQLVDITFPPAASSATLLPASIPVCIYSTTGSLSITATSPNAAGPQLQMTDGVNFINYAADMTDVAGPTTAALAHGVPSAALADGAPIDDLCGGGTNASLTVTIDGVDFDAEPAGVYTDTLTLTLSAL